MKQDTVDNKDQAGKSKASVHGRAVRPDGWMPEGRMDGCEYAEGCEDRDIGPVYLLKSRIAVEAVVDARNGRSPHQYYDSDVV